MRIFLSKKDEKALEKIKEDADVSQYVKMNLLSCALFELTMFFWGISLAMSGFAENILLNKFTGILFIVLSIMALIENRTHNKKLSRAKKR